MTAPKAIWVFYPNHRVYRPGGKGGPIWREHWVLEDVTGETSRSWIVGGSTRARGRILVPKNGTHNRRAIAFTEAEIEDERWRTDNCWRIGDAVARVENVTTLRAIAALIKYVEPPA